MKTILFVRQTAIYNDSRALKTIRTLSKEYRVIVLGWDRDGLARTNTKALFDTERVQCLFYEKRLKHGSGLKGIFKLWGFIRWTARQFKRYKSEISYVHACDLDGALGIGLAGFWAGATVTALFLCVAAGRSPRRMWKTIALYPIFVASWYPLHIISLVSAPKAWHPMTHIGAGQRAA